MGNMLFSKKNPASNAINPEVAERRINAGKSRMSRVRAWFHRNDEAVSSPAGTSSCLSPEQITAILDAEANVRERAKSGKISRVCVGTGYNLVDVPWASRHPFVATMFELLGPSNGWQDQTVTVPVEEKVFRRIEADNTELEAARVKFFGTVELAISGLTQTREHLAGIKVNREDSIDANALRAAGNLKDGKPFEFEYSLLKPPISSSMFHQCSWAIEQEKVGPVTLHNASTLISAIEMAFLPPRLPG